MTTRTFPSPIEIISDAGLRAAAQAGAAVIAFDVRLDTVLFADAGGRDLIGTSPTSPTLRQIRSAARALAEAGRARVRLRRSTRAGSVMVEADLVLRPADGGRAPFVLLSLPALGRALDDADLLAAADLLDKPAAVFAKGTLQSETATFSQPSPFEIAERIAAFEAGAEATATLDEGSARLTLVRAPFGRILAWSDVRDRSGLDHGSALLDPAPQDGDPLDAGTPGASPALPDPPAGFASFSVKRAKLGEPRPGMSMSALLQRWHSRGPETGGEAQVPEADLRERPDATDAGTPADGPATPAPDTATTRPEAVAKQRLRSQWGPTVIAPPAEAGLRDDPETGGRAEATADASGEPHDAAQNVSDPSGYDGTDRAAGPVAGDSAETVGSGERMAMAPQVAEKTAFSDRAEEPEASEERDGEASAKDAAAEQDAGRETEAASKAPAPSPAGTSGASAPIAVPAAFSPRFDIAPVRFVWQIDREGAFRFLSPDFAGAVGPHAADVVGRSFATVARVFGFDETREIARLLERRDTWSGRTIFWPVEGSDRKVPVDLAALPVYGRDRSFDGFRGFGIVRLNESVPDEEGLGLHLTAGPAPVRDETRDVEASIEGTESAVPEMRREKPFLRRFEAESFGRRAEPPVPSEAEPDEDGDRTQKVIRLEERRRPREGALSTAEEAAFRAIGAKLGSKAEAESPGALRFEDSTTPAMTPAIGETAAEDAGMPVNLEPGSEAGEKVETPEDPVSTAAMSAVPEPSALSRRLETDGIAPDGIEPALEALSEKLARAEAEADRRLAARRTAKTAPKADPAPEHAGAHAPEASPAPEAPASIAAAGVDEGADDVLPDADDRPADPAAESAGPVLDATAETLADAFEEPVIVVPASPAAAEAMPTGDLVPVEPSSDDEVGTDEEADEPPLDIAVFERLFAGLPLAVLVQVRENTVYVNAEFAALTGHADAAAVEAAGGLDVLVLDRQGEGTLALMCADGEIVDVRAHMQRIAEGGRSALLMSFARAADETALAGPALDDLRQEVEELQAVLDTATDGVVLLDINGNIRAMNGSAHALFGIGADEAFGRHLSSLFAPESQRSTVDYLDMLRDDGIGGILNDGREVVGRVSQGGFIPLFITIGRLSGERGWCVVIRDIAHWKRIEEDLVNARRQAEAASLHKSRFLANISHELRTPLNAIIGFADVMSSECFGPIGNERYLEYLGDIKRSGHHVLDLVNDLLDISKIEAGKIDLSFEAVALNEVISEAVSLMQPQANRERVIVRSNLPSSVPPVVADRRTMRQIALNLLANAIRFTPAGGQIIASTTYSAEGDVLLRFRDSGIGMTEREIELALTPFQQVHAPSANRGEGTGLGLPLTKAMVEANRAYFSIQSTPGEGTLVEIVFPAPRVLAE